MLHMIKIFIAVVSVALVAATARAELVFEQSTIELHPAIGDQQAVAHFKYQNKGDKPVAIKNVSTSCGCTAATAGGKTSAAPGEKGEVTATFSIGDRIGTQLKQITVGTDDAPTPNKTLTLKVYIPQLLELKQPLAIWQANEAPKPKTIIATANKDGKIQNVEVTSSSPDFTAKVEPGAAGEFKIVVQPKATDKAIATTLTIKPVTADGKSKNLFATARVMPVPPGQTQASPRAEDQSRAAAKSAVDSVAVPSATTAAAKGKHDPCSLLTSKDIEAVQGEALKSPMGNSNATNGLINAQCYFGLATASNSISLTVTERANGVDARSPKEVWEDIFRDAERNKDEKGERAEKGEKAEKAGGEHGEENEKGLPPKKINGIGDEAFWSGNRVGGALYVLKGDTFIRISVGGADDEAAKIDKSKKLAKIILKRL